VNCKQDRLIVLSKNY